MRFVVNEPARGEIDVSLVLPDWACRESFHVLDYLAEQTVARGRYEIVWIEYYDRPSPRLERRIAAARAGGRAPPVDIYAVMEMDPAVCYHKHLMYNLGILLARGRIVCFADSDAMVRPTFVESIVRAFEAQPGIVLHLDEARNNRPSFYPFSHPAFEDVTGFGCINWIDGRPAGLLDRADPLHTRNYGACMAALRDDLIAVGGADMHADYLGHICGPYEMTWRLVNAGRREVWADDEWLYHTWHPGQAGDRNVAGPHDGMSISTRALQSRRDGRVTPFAENPAVAMLRADRDAAQAELLDVLIEPKWRTEWQYSGLETAERSFDLGSRRIRLKEHGCGEAAAVDLDAAARPLFGTSLSGLARLRLYPLVLRIAWRQLKVKRRAAAWSRCDPGAPRAREWLRKLRALKAFLGRILAFDRYWFRQCWMALSYAAQEGRRELALYGEGDAARVLCALSRYSAAEVTGICPLRPDPPRRLLGRPTLSEDRLARSQATVVIAAFVNIPAHVARLEELGIPRDRIITLR